MRISGMELQLHNRDGGSYESIKRAVDLSLATTATLSVSYSGFGEGGLDIVAIEASDDGGTSFTVLDQVEIVGYPSGRSSVPTRAEHCADRQRRDSLSNCPGPGRNNPVRRLRRCADRIHHGRDDRRDQQYPAAASPKVISRLIVGADLLHAEGINGAGVTIGVIDTGFFPTSGLSRDARQQLAECVFSTMRFKTGSSDDRARTTTTATATALTWLASP